MDYLLKIYNKFNSSNRSYRRFDDIPKFWKSKYFCIGLTVGYGVLFYLRRKIQGYYFDYKAIVSLKDLSGKTAIITGGNSGVGLGSAIHLARLNANVIIACRNDKRAAVAVEYIKKKSGNNNINYMNLDLSNLKSVELFASKINENEDICIDYFILNAGIARASTPSNDGLDAVFQTNYLSHWYLTNLVLDRIKQTANKRWSDTANKYGAPVRIVCVSSGAHTSKHIPLDDKGWDKLIKGGCDYGQSKLLQIVHMKQLQQILHEYDQMIQCVSITPGMVRTGIVMKLLPMVMYPVFILLYPIHWYLSRDIMMGSQVVLHAVTNNKVVNGAYYSNCRLKPTEGKNGCSNDVTLWRNVWNRTDTLIKSLQANTFF